MEIKANSIQSEGLSNSQLNEAVDNFISDSKFPRNMVAHKLALSEKLIIDKQKKLQDLLERADKAIRTTSRQNVEFSQKVNAKLVYLREVLIGGDNNGKVCD